jgi:hypothetical protein
VNRLQITFEKGGILIADLNNKTPNTIKSIMEILPIESTVFHTKWCGREISFGIETTIKPPFENHTNTVSKFDVAYWRDWENKITEDNFSVKEAIAIYYGPEILRYHGGLLTTNIIGRIAWEQEDLLDSIGTRIWKCGCEKVIIDKCD